MVAIMNINSSLDVFSADFSILVLSQLLVEAS